MSRSGDRSYSADTLNGSPARLGNLPFPVTGGDPYRGESEIGADFYRDREIAPTAGITKFRECSYGKTE